MRSFEEAGKNRRGLVSGDNIVILTGAGISKESGLDTFRDANGLWTKVRIEDVATPEAYARDPKGVLDFYNMRRGSMTSGNITPNAAHSALAKLEREYSGDVLIVTQNIDNLHQAAGNKHVIEYHGNGNHLGCRQCQTTSSKAQASVVVTWCFVTRTPLPPSSAKHRPHTSVVVVAATW